MRGLESWRQLRLGLAGLILIGLLGALLGGQALARNLGVDRPLAREMKAIPGLRDYSLRDGADGSVNLELALERVDDLEKTMDRILAGLAAHRKQPIKEITIRDRRPGLDEAYYSLRFSLAEAMATGQYTKLQESLVRLASSAGLNKARVYLATGFIYIQLEKGRNYLYQAVPRPVPPAESVEGGDG